MSCTISTDISNVIKSAEDIGNAQDALLGLHPFSVSLVEIMTIGADRPGHGGTRVRTDTRLTLLDGYSSNYPGDGYLNPCFKQVGQKEVMLSNGRLKDIDFCIGPFVQPYVKNNCDGTTTQLGTDSTDFDPPVGVSREIYFFVHGPGLDAAGSYFKQLYTVEDDAISFKVYVRNTGTKIS